MGEKKTPKESRDVGLTSMKSAVGHYEEMVGRLDKQSKEVKEAKGKIEALNEELSATQAKLLETEQLLEREMEERDAMMMGCLHNDNDDDHDGRVVRELEMLVKRCKEDFEVREATIRERDVAHLRDVAGNVQMKKVLDEVGLTAPRLTEEEKDLETAIEYVVGQADARAKRTRMTMDLVQRKLEELQKKKTGTMTPTPTPPRATVNRPASGRRSIPIVDVTSSPTTDDAVPFPKRRKVATVEDEATLRFGERWRQQQGQGHNVNGGGGGGEGSSDDNGGCFDSTTERRRNNLRRRRQAWADGREHNPGWGQRRRQEDQGDDDYI